jgi:hypothetical protein
MAVGGFSDWRCGYRANRREAVHGLVVVVAQGSNHGTLEQPRDLALTRRLVSGTYNRSVYTKTMPALKTPWACHPPVYMGLRSMVAS